MSTATALVKMCAATALWPQQATANYRAQQHHWYLDIGLCEYNYIIATCTQVAGEYGYVIGSQTKVDADSVNHRVVFSYPLFKNPVNHISYISSIHFVGVCTLECVFIVDIYMVK